MKKYRFTTHTSNDTLSTTNANSIQEAIEYFAALKQLPVEEFMNIFQVKFIRSRTIFNIVAQN